MDRQQGTVRERITGGAKNLAAGTVRIVFVSAVLLLLLLGFAYYMGTH